MESSQAAITMKAIRRMAAPSKTHLEIVFFEAGAASGEGGVGTYDLSGLVLSPDPLSGAAVPAAVKDKELEVRCGDEDGGPVCGRRASPKTWRVSVLSGLKRRQFCRIRVRSVPLALVFAYQNQAETL